MDLKRRDALIKVFTKKPPSEKEALLIQALAEHPGTSAYRLSDIVWGSGKNAAFQLHFGRICSTRMADLPPQYQERRDPRDPSRYYWAALLLIVPGTVKRGEDRGEISFTLRPEARAAFEILGVLQSAPASKQRNGRASARSGTSGTRTSKPGPSRAGRAKP